MLTESDQFHGSAPTKLHMGFHGVMVSTLDFKSSDPSSNLSGTGAKVSLHPVVQK